MAKTTEAGNKLMKIETTIPLLESIFEDWQELLGEEFLGYRNHVYRMIHCCFALYDCNEQDREKIIIAAAFHDIGIWIENTLDYLPPSIPPAKEYLQKKGLSDWEEEISLMISEHHKLTEFSDSRYPLVEVFRKGDLVDFSLGTVKFGLSPDFITELKSAFPNTGFHKVLARRASKWFIRHPLNPAPMMKL